MAESVSRLRLPVLLVLFAATGCASLIYEIVWFQLLQLVIGSSAVSLGILLGTFMGGMCLGSLLMPRYVGIERHPLRVYAGIEAGIALCGLAVLFGMPLVDRVYAVTGGNGAIGIAVRALVCAVCLLGPTVLMGASLPAIARWMESTPAGAARLGFFYGANIAGAVAGCLIAGFWLLRLHDTAVATYSAVTLNLLAAAASFLLARYTRYKRPEVVTAADPGAGDTTILVSLALSGFCALAAEVVWTRLLSLILGGTVYTFSIILAVFLFGLGIGSSVASLGARDSVRAKTVFGWCQALLAAAIAWSGTMLTQSLPYWPVTPAHAPTAWVNFQLDLVRCLWAILPATLLWGASFPLAVAAAARPGIDAGRVVGRLYAANTAGAIAGAVGCSMVLIPWIGTQHAQQLLIAAAGVAGAILLWSVPGRWAFAAVVLTVAVGSIRLLPATPWELIAYGRTVANSIGSRDLVLEAEGMNASIAITRIASTRFFHVSGKVEASSQGQDMRLQRMLGHLPAVLHPDPQSVLVVGFGAGVTAGTFVTHPSVRRLAICEIEPLIPRLVGPEFRAENHNVLREPRTEVIYDDGRHFVLTAREKFDIITSDPIHPWVKGNAALYTREYFEHCKRRLKPGGIVTQWVPLYESDFDAVKSEIATFFDVFPQGTIWGNDFDGEGYDIVLLGQEGPTNIDAPAIQRRMEKHRTVEQSMREAGFRTVDDLLDTYAGRAEDLREWLAGAQINRDRNLRLQYIAGMSLNSVKAGAIYEEILRQGRARR